MPQEIMMHALMRPPPSSMAQQAKSLSHIDLPRGIATASRQPVLMPEFRRLPSSMAVVETRGMSSLYSPPRVMLRGAKQEFISIAKAVKTLQQVHGEGKPGHLPRVKAASEGLKTRPFLLSSRKNCCSITPDALLAGIDQLQPLSSAPHGFDVSNPSNQDWSVAADPLQLAEESSAKDLMDMPVPSFSQWMHTRKNASIHSHSKLSSQLSSQMTNHLDLQSAAVGLASVITFLTLASPGYASVMTEAVSKVVDVGSTAVGTVSGEVVTDFTTRFQNGFLSAFLLIFFSEIGDKTFFIAVLLATRNSKSIVFAGALGALVVMTVLSVVIGRFFHALDEVVPISFGNIDVPVDDILAVIMLVYFGVSTLRDAWNMEESRSDEEQREAELAIAGVDGQQVAVLASTFALVFVAEWGDKSFFSTIALAAASSPAGVIAGAIVGHSMATTIAVLGGSLLSGVLSEKVIAYTGGSLFIFFALLTVAEIFQRVG